MTPQIICGSITVTASETGNLYPPNPPLFWHVRAELVFLCSPFNHVCYEFDVVLTKLSCSSIA